MKKKLLKDFLVMALVVSMLASLTACGNSGETEPKTEQDTEQDTAQVENTSEGDEFSILEGKTISFMTSQAKFFPAYETMAEEIKKDYGCNVEFQVIPDGEYDSLVMMKLSTSEVPDIYEENIPSRNSTYGVSQYCEDLSNEPWVSRLVNPDLIKDSSDGKIYGLPKESSSGYQAVYYNKEVLEACGITDPQPKTYDEFLDILATVKEKGNGVVPFYQTNADTWTTQIFMTGGIACALGENAVEVTNKLLANEIKWTDIPETQELLQNYIDLNKAGYMNDDNMSVGYDTAVEAICTGKAAMYLTIEQWAADAKAKYPDCELGSFIIPHNDNLLLPTGNYVQGLFVPSAGSQVDAAKAFLQVWSMPKYQNMYYVENPGFPAYNDVDGGTVVPVVQSLVDTYITAGNYVFEMNSLMSAASGINVDMWDYYIEALQGDKTPAEVFESVQKNYVDYMEQQGVDGF